MPSRAVTLATPALVVEYGADADARSIPFVATARGIRSKDWTRICSKTSLKVLAGCKIPPDDDLLLEAFVYYWVYDAFLPTAREASGAYRWRSVVTVARSMHVLAVPDLARSGAFYGARWGLKSATWAILAGDYSSTASAESWPVSARMHCQRSSSVTTRTSLTWSLTMCRRTLSAPAALASSS